MPADPARPGALDEEAVEAVAEALMEQAWNVTATLRPDVREKYRREMREKVRSVLADADLVPLDEVLAFLDGQTTWEGKPDMVSKAYAGLIRERFRGSRGSNDGR